MGWKLYSPPDREELIEFLSKDEWGHVAFSSRLKETKESSTPQWIYIRRENSPGARITEAVLFTQEGLLMPVFSRSAAPFRPELEQVLFQKKPRKKLNTVMGLRNDVEVIQRLVKPARRAEVTYHVMILQDPPRPVRPENGVVCRRAKPRDAGMLFPLQKGYEIEEVLLDPDTFNSGVCYLHLQRSLRHEIVIYASIDGRAVAKAATNAQGFSYSQIGGVYTVEEARKRGVGEQVLSMLLGRIFRTGSKASLFVKKNNQAAIALYKKLGFTVRDEFKIAYY